MDDEQRVRAGQSLLEFAGHLAPRPAQRIRRHRFRANYLTAHDMRQVFLSTCLRGMFDDHSKNAAEYATSRLNLFDTKSTSNLQVALALLGGVFAFLKYESHTSSLATLIPFFGLVICTMLVAWFHFRTNDILLYAAPESFIHDTLDTSETIGNLQISHGIVQDYLAFLSYFVLARDSFRYRQRQALSGCVLFTFITVAFLMWSHWKTTVTSFI